MELIQSRYGDLYILTEADLISDSLRRYGEWAQREIDLLCAFIGPGDTVVDAGAYLGTHTRAFSERVGSDGLVYGFEPNPSSFSVLQHNARMAPLGNIQLFNLGIGAMSQSCALQVDDSLLNRASATMAGSAGASVATVPVRALDDIGIARVNLIKVDVEGMELQLLRGAECTITREQPVIFLEVNSLAGSLGLLPWAEQHGYLVYGVNVAAFNPDNYARSAVNVFGSAREVGLLLIPSRAFEQFAARLEHFELPLIDSLDALALLLLHKPQYLREVLGATDVRKRLGLDFEHVRETCELQALLEAKDRALGDAAQAYKALRQAFDQKENELKQAFAKIKGS
ncbi:MAG: FkbM family methyltransferase [Pseudomonas sp.]|uniref:FkbM family methyltransferase n=1 Tax=Pseudomonas sp. TaxID=306 RepID=UPI003391E8DD